MYQRIDINRNNDCALCKCLSLSILFILMLVLLFANIILAIYGTVILAQNDDAIHEPENVWIYILIQVILLYCISLGVGNEIIIQKDKGSETRTSSSSNVLGLANLGVSIWGMIIYYESDAATVAFYKSDFPGLWTCLQVFATYFVCLYSILAGLLVLNYVLSFIQAILKN